MKLQDFTKATRTLMNEDSFSSFRYGALKNCMEAICSALETASGVRAHTLNGILSEKNTYWKAKLMGCEGSWQPEKAWELIQSEFNLMNAEIKQAMLNEINNQFKDNTDIKRLWTTVLNEKNLVPLASFITNPDQKEEETLDNKQIKQQWATALSKQDDASLDHPIRDHAQVDVEENDNHSPEPTNYNLLLTISASLLATSSAASLCVVALALTPVITTLSMTSIIAIAATGLISGAAAGYLFFKTPVMGFKY